MRRFIIAILGICLVMTAGCASKYGGQKTTVNYYPGCYKPIQELRDSESYVSKSTAGGAILGAFGGAIIGLLASGGKWEGAVVGGATGGVAGTMAGNMYGRHRQQQDDNIRLAGYLQDIEGDISNLNSTSAAATASLQCYDRQFKVLLGEIRARQISREAAAARFAEISSGREEAIGILGNAVVHGSNLNYEYEKAFETEEQQLNVPAPTPRANAEQAKKVNTIRVAKQRKTRLVQKTQAIKEDRDQAMAESSRQIAEMNQAMAELEELRR